MIRRSNSKLLVSLLLFIPTFCRTGLLAGGCGFIFGCGLRSGSSDEGGVLRFARLAGGTGTAAAGFLWALRMGCHGLFVGGGGKRLKIL